MWLSVAYTLKAIETVKRKSKQAVLGSFTSRELTIGNALVNFAVGLPISAPDFYEVKSFDRLQVHFLKLIFTHLQLSQILRRVVVCIILSNNLSKDSLSLYFYF